MAHITRLTKRNSAELSEKYGCSFAVVRKSQKLDFSIVYENNTYIIYLLGDMDVIIPSERVENGKKYSPKPKFQLVLELLKDNKTPSQVARAYNFHPNSAGIWERIPQKSHPII